jgi:hypothetical protein
MNLESQVAPLAEAMRMKALGFPQTSWLAWVGAGDGTSFLAQTGMLDSLHPLCAAYSVAEMGEWMPKDGYSFWRDREKMTWFIARGWNSASGTTEAEARARLLIALAEAGALDVKGLK